MNNIAIVVYAHYSRVARVRKYAESLANENFHLDIICLNEQFTPRQKNIHLIKYPLERKRISQLWYLMEYFLFFIFAFIHLFRLTFKKKYRIIQIHNMPEVLVFSALIPKILGSKIILDMHDPMPELYMTKYHVEYSYPLVKFLIFIEKICFTFSDHIIAANRDFRKVYIKRHPEIENKISVIGNFPDPSIFKKRKNNNSVDKKKFNLIYMGSIDERFGLDMIINGIELLLNKMPAIRLTIIPRISYEGLYFQKILDLIKNKKLENHIRILSPCPLEEIVNRLTQCELGIVPLKKSVFTDLLIPVKLLEFIHMKIPVIASPAATLKKTFHKNELYFMEKNSPPEFAKAVENLYLNKKLREKLKVNAAKYLLTHNWAEEKRKYLKIINSLLDRKVSLSFGNVSRR